jgi:fibronectin type 3 domain-containing protein
MKKLVLFLLLLHSMQVNAQDSLPDFSVVNKGNNRIIISWNNKFKQLKQITIQRSSDSLSNFKSIVSVPDPNNRQNGYMDSKAQDDKMFYRLYILVDGSNFIFSKPKRPVMENLAVKPEIIPTVDSSLAVDSSLIRVLKKIEQKNPDSALTVEEIQILKKYRNSKVTRIPDSISRKIDAAIKIGNRPEIVIPLNRIYSYGDGTVMITLKDYQQKKYSIRMYEDDDSFLFEIKSINAATLKLDKSNFYHSGWFKSELYDNGKLVEKNRFFIPKDF